MLNLEAIRADFPILSQRINDHALVYLDNAATTQKPRQVIDAIVRYYETENANIHRGVHTLSQRATDHYEQVRRQVAAFINAPNPDSVIFTQGTTDSVNMVMSSWGLGQIKEGQNIVLSQPEHHSNLVPWQMLAERTGAELRFLSLNDQGILGLDELDGILDAQTALVAVQQMSNVLGSIHPIQGLIDAAHAVGAKVLVDAAQSVPHMPVDVQSMDCDFLVFSAHKMLGPTGVGVMYAKAEILEQMPPYRGGGAMIKEVWPDRYTWADLPYRFEAGTPNIAGVIGFGAAIDYINQIGLSAILEHEQMLTAYALDKMKSIENLVLYGPDDLSQRGGIIAFNFKGIHPRDVGEILDQQGVAIRTGHHCCQPLMQHYGVSGMARASFYLYNTCQEVDSLVNALGRAQRLFSRVAGR